MRKQIFPALLLFAALTSITGVAYPLIVTAIAQSFLPRQAGGSLIEHDGKVVGSELIGQPFGDQRYFWSRPSATAPFPYNAAASCGSNLGPTNPALLAAVRARIAELRAHEPAGDRPVPVDLVTASASGLDPHLSPAAALWQVPRVARARRLSEVALRRLVGEHTEGRTLGVLGEPRVNVLRLNLALGTLK
jgi:K+-transporting ATPase ATPase C chain